MLIVLDNIESLLDAENRWRDARWGELVKTLLDHRGLSRAVLTSRRMPIDLEAHPDLHREPIHALSFPESVVLARELEGLAGLFATSEGRSTLQRVLAMAQGHPKLLELAAGLAKEDREALARQLDRDEARAAGAAGKERSFLRKGESGREAEGFVAVLEAWTDQVAAGLPPAARLLFEVLSCAEEEDRDSAVLAANWGDILARLSERRIESHRRAEDGRLRLLTRGPSYAELVGESFAQIRQHAGGDVVVLERLLWALEALATRTSSAARRAVLLDHAQALLAEGERTIAAAREREDFHVHATGVLVSLRAG